MVFSSIVFLFLFLPLTLLLYYIVGRRFRNAVLLITSLLFYFWGEGRYVSIMILYMAANYIFGILIEKENVRKSSNARNRAKLYVIIAIAFNLGLLIFFKYSNFVIDNINLLTPGHPIKISLIHLPIGISFFSFQAMSYVIDVYRMDVKAQKNIITFSMYKALFPQLIAGPIVRYRDIANQVNDRIFNSSQFVDGIKRFITGLGKKVLIANNVAVVADILFQTPASHISPWMAWIGTICYALQIYFDFSGYSDMAIGLGKMFGFDFLENFNYPYISKSIKEFWRRWHISLSNWFRDYVYISLGGNRVAVSRTYLNLVIVFFLCGLWHGASWTFILWGLWHGMFLVIERTQIGKLLKRRRRFTQYIYTAVVVLLGWVLFRADSVGQAIQISKAMFFISSTYAFDLPSYLNVKITVAILFALAGATPIFPVIAKKINAAKLSSLPGIVSLNGIKFLFYILIFALSVVFLANTTYNPFIYFRF